MIFMCAILSNYKAEEWCAKTTSQAGSVTAVEKQQNNQHTGVPGSPPNPKLVLPLNQSQNTPNQSHII